MEKIKFSLIVLVGVFGIVYSQCPSVCHQCTRGKWNCEGTNITNEILLDIARNGGAFTAKELLLNKNNITDFPSHEFTNFTNLEELNLGENHLVQIPRDLYKNIPSLKKISLMQNNLRKITRDDFVGYDNIIELDLFKNNIDQLEPNTFENLSNLKKLYAESNKIKTLRNGTLNGLSKLTQLSFKGNDLEDIEAGVLHVSPNLERLWFNKNKLTSLPEGLFKNLKSLYSLDLEGNQLTDHGLPTGIFKDLLLDDLMLSENNFTTLKNDWFGRVKFAITLSNNPVVCDCRIYKTYQILLNKVQDNIDVSGSCKNPRSLENISIKKHFEENLSNCTACSVNKCQNNANCTVFDAQSFAYNCTCPRQFFGQYCETEDFCICLLYTSPSPRDS